MKWQSRSRYWAALSCLSENLEGCWFSTGRQKPELLAFFRFSRQLWRRQHLHRLALALGSEDRGPRLPPASYAAQRDLDDPRLLPEAIELSISPQSLFSKC